MTITFFGAFSAATATATGTVGAGASGAANPVWAKAGKEKAISAMLSERQGMRRGFMSRSFITSAGSQYTTATPTGGGWGE